TSVPSKRYRAGIRTAWLRPFLKSLPTMGGVAFIGASNGLYHDIDHKPAAFKPAYRPSRYQVEPSASNSRPRPRKPPNSGVRVTAFRMLSPVVRKPIQSRPEAGALPLTGTMPGRSRPARPDEMRRTLPPVSLASGASV